MEMMIQSGRVVVGVVFGGVGFQNSAFRIFCFSIRVLLSVLGFNNFGMHLGFKGVRDYRSGIQKLLWECAVQ